MSKKNSSKDIPRRKFLKNFSSGVIGTSVLIKNLQSTTKDNTDKTPLDVKSEKGKIYITLIVNGSKKQVAVYANTTLAQLLRYDLNLTGTKIVCNHGECGACTVLLDGKAVYSCHLLALDAAGKEVLTIEGLMDGEKLHPVQEVFIEHDGLQCGFCTPGQIMSAQANILENPSPGREEIIKGMSGNLCRCAAYPNILKSAIAAAEISKKS